MKHTLKLALATSVCGLWAISASAAPASRQSGIVTFEANCPSDTEQQSLLAALVGVVAKPVIEYGIKAFGGALSAAGADKDFALQAQSPVLFYELSKSDGSAHEMAMAGGCVVMAFGPEGGDPGSVYDAGWTQASMAWLKDNGYSSPPAFYLEAKASTSDDRSALRLEPVTAWVGRPMGPRGIASKIRDLALTVSLISPGNFDDNNVLSARSIVFRAVPTQQFIVSGLPSKSTSWFPMPALPEGLTERLTAANTRLSDLRETEQQITDLEKKASRTKEEEATLATARKSMTDLSRLVEADKKALARLMPLTLRVDLHETRDGNAFVAKLGEILTDKASDIAQPLAERLDPEKRRSTAIAEGAATDTLRKAVIEKVTAWQTTAADPASTEAQTRVALIEARAACRELRLNGHSMADCNTLPTLQ